MEVCGTHTSTIVKSGIRSFISPNIKLISGPGCPVCVTPAAYIDKCVDYSHRDNHILASFGDMMKVPGTAGSLAEAKSKGARVELMYSPFEVISKAEKNADITYVLAAVGFETTAAVYSQFLKEIEATGLRNIKLITAFKTIFPALSWICENEKHISGFICPGHVSAITGITPYQKLMAEFDKPFVVAGFDAEHVIAAIYELVHAQLGKKQPNAINLYKSAVKDKGNIKAQATMNECFVEGSAFWRGIGLVESSGLYLNDKYAAFDGGSFGLDNDIDLPHDCRCKEVIVGRISPPECPMFGKKCTKSHPIGPCMVSSEGACGIWS